MARSQKSLDLHKAPELIAWHVTNRGENAYWTKIGASWQHKDGKGMTLQLETLPMTGRIVLRAPREETDQRARA